jgi:pyrimidine-nucleoside phosphorylase
LLSLSDLGVELDKGMRLARDAISNGSALETYERWIRAQGGNPDLSRLPTAPVVKEARAPREGAVVGLGALAVGVAALELGAGRRTKEDPVDHSVGIVLRAKRGDEIASGDVLAEIHASDDASADRAVEAVLAAYEIGDERPRARGILIDVVE